MDLLTPQRPLTRPRVGVLAWFTLLVGVWALWLSPAGASAQVFSPGELSRAHAAFDGLGSCDKCHGGQQTLDRGKCLSCHELIAQRQRTREGYHGQADVKIQDCQSCHPEHGGRGASIVTWPAGGQERFPHSQTGWPLRGAHATVKCQTCHALDRVQDKDVRAYVQAQHKAGTWLGLDTPCTSCHFDEHRGSLEGGCESCHTEKAWKPAPGFQHASAWRLEGAHTRVECVECHERLTDPAPPSTYPKPRAATYLKMTGIPHEACTDCHIDPHRGRFGADCRSCHTADDWTVRLQTGAPRAVAFHDKTAFPLEGRHQAVACDGCHPHDRAGKRVLKPLPHGRCSDCHATAHPELPAEAGGCEACHTVAGFTPTTFTLEAHADTRFPLEEAHQAVSCVECHRDTLGDGAVPPPAKGPARRSPWRLATTAPLDRCETCHTSPHRDQFPGRVCGDCHTSDTWLGAARFDHAEAGYPLTGAHTEVDCALCHVEAEDERGPFTRYRPLPADTCERCHTDAHYGQFTRVEPPLACERCHTTAAFGEHRFDHQDAALSDWPLEGKHALVDCQGCHPTLRLAESVPVRRFRPSPQACQDCHLDPHDGAYREAARLLGSTGAPSTSEPGPALLAGVEGPQPLASPGEGTSCEVCHRPEGWASIGFNHAVTGYPLAGEHQGARCQDCHRPDRVGPVPTDCASCHENVHRGMVGQTCETCHNEVDFQRPILPVAQHARGGFPLVGKHAVTACRECHLDTRSLGFDQAPSDCASCHLQALATLGPGAMDHSQLSTRCEQCHTPLSWGAANYRLHDRCFPITPGSEHSGLPCASCHTSGLPAVTGACLDSGATCVQCHGCEEGEHQDVRGYECADRKCYQCHPGGT